MKIAYLASRYPALTHAFLRREVEGLRAAGIEVETVSVRRPREEELLSEADRTEADRTATLLPPNPLVLAGAHLAVFFRSPGGYLRTLALAVRGAGPGLRNRLWSLFYFAEAALLVRHCRGEGIEHVHAVQFADSAADVAMLAAELGGPSWSLTVHGPGELEDPARYRLAEKVRRADFAVAVCCFIRERLLELAGPEHAERIHVVHMGVDPERFRPAGRRDPDSAAVRILCVARLVPHKGQAVLLGVIARLRDEGLALETTLVGDGPEHEPLECHRAELGLDRLVSFAGPVGQDELPGLYAAADIHCLPSLSESVGVVSIEAMATGLAVVSSDLMGVPELIEDGVSGLLVSAGDEDELAAALRRLAEDPALRRRLGEEGRRKVLAEFDSAIEAGKLAALLAGKT